MKDTPADPRADELIDHMETELDHIVAGLKAALPDAAATARAMSAETVQ